MINWKPTTEERFWEMLGCVPPAARSGSGFLVGEAYDHRHGQPTFQAFKQVGEDFFQSATDITFAEFKAEFPSAEYYYR